MKITLGTSVFAIALAAAIAVQPAQAQATAASPTSVIHSVSIEEQPLGAALTELSKQTGAPVVLSAPLVAGRIAPRVSGDLTVDQALAKLLTNSGLEARRSESGAIVVAQADTGTPPVGPTGNNERDVIIVTGEKTERTLQDTTSSVLVLEEELVQDLTFTDLTDLYRFAPNVGQIESSEGIFSIRGVSAIGGIGFSGEANSSTLYVDDIFQSNLGIEAGPSGIFDISQVEIFRGPQSTIQGRNALFGAVVVRTQDPTYDWDAKGRFEYSEFNTQRYGLAFGGPIIDNTLAFRVAGDFRTTDGFITNPTTGRDDQDADESLTLRSKLLFEPTDIFSALVTYVYTEGDASTGFGSGVVQGPDFFDRTVNVDNPTLQSITTHNVAVDLQFEITEALSLVSITTYSDASETSSPRFGIQPGATSLDLGSDSEEIFTTDLRLVYEEGAINLLGGFFYFDRDQANDRDLRFDGFVTPFGSTNVSIIGVSARQTENWALYFDGKYQFTDRLSLLLGGRFDRENFSIQSQNSTLLDPDFPPFFVSNVGSELDSDTKFDAFLPKAGLQFELTDNQTVAFVVQRGYRSGGAGVTLGGDPFEFGSEFLWNYEVSYRSTWLDGKILLNANAFYADWKDQQVVTTINELDGRISNAGESRLWGFEAELFANPLDGLTLFTTVGYNNTKFTDFDDVNPLFNGNEFPQSPEFQTSFGAVYQHVLGFFVSADGTYVSDAFSDSENAPSALDPDDNALDSYIVFNAKVGYRSNFNWALYGFVRNAFDEEYAFGIDQDDFRSGGLGSATIGAPQVFGLELTFDY